MPENNKPKKQINWEAVVLIGGVAIVGASIALQIHRTNSQARIQTASNDRTNDLYKTYLDSLLEGFRDGSIKVHKDPEL